MIFQHVLYITFAESKLGKIFISTHTVLMSFMIIANDYRSFILNITTCTKRCVTQWIWKLRMSFEIHRVRQYLVNLTGLAGTINLRVYKTDIIFSGIGNCLNFNTAFVHTRTQNQTRSKALHSNATSSRPIPSFKCHIITYHPWFFLYKRHRGEQQPTESISVKF